MSAVMSIFNIEKPSREIALELQKRVSDVTDDVNRIALFAYGAVLRKVGCDKLRKAGAEFLVAELQNAVNSKNTIYAASLLHAIGNAGPTVVSLNSIPSSVFDHENSQVKSAAINALRKYPVEFSEEISDGNFPFNKSYDATFTLGGSAVNVKFDGQLFAGTNFDCNQQYFNYEALAEATADVAAWGFQKQALVAEAIYGKVNGQIAGNEILLKVWDDVIYDQSMPTVDCNMHTYPLGHTAPGFSVQYTLWVSVIPVVFSASVNLDLNLDWGWQICDSQLSALVELVPSATLVVGGSAEVDLLIIKGGIELDGSFNTDLIPQGFIHGSECTVGFDIERKSNPMDVALTAYYATEKCTLWIFDCHWGQTNTHNVFSWDYPAVDTVILNQQWQIAA